MSDASLLHILVLPGLPELAAEQLGAGPWKLHEPQADGAPPSGVSVTAVVASGGTAVPNGLIDALPDLKIIAVHGVGQDKVDVAHARSRGVIVTNTPEVLSADVADLALALILSTLRLLPAAERWLRAGHWAAREKFPLGRSATGLKTASWAWAASGGRLRSGWSPSPERSPTTAAVRSKAWSGGMPSIRSPSPPPSTS